MMHYDITTDTRRWWPARIIQAWAAALSERQEAQAKHAAAIDGALDRIGFLFDYDHPDTDLHDRDVAEAAFKATLAVEVEALVAARITAWKEGRL